MKYNTYSNNGDDHEINVINENFFLIGLLNEFTNRFQTMADKQYKEMSWKQYFVLVCINLFKYSPTLSELSDVVGSSHQNVKQLLLKLEKSGYVELITDTEDKRKQRISLTSKAMYYCQKQDNVNSVRILDLYATVDMESLRVTIDTIMKLDEQLKKL